MGKEDYKNEKKGHGFLCVPKELLFDNRYKQLTIEAILLYAYMLDRLKLSIENGWKDSDGKVFIYFSLESIMDLLKCSKGKAISTLKELDEKHGIGLIEKKRSGYGKCSRIYVKEIFELSVSENEKTREKNEEDLEVTNKKHEKSKNKMSRSSKIEPIEVKKINPNNTNKSNTNKSNTKSNHIFRKDMEEKITIEQQIRTNIDYDCICYRSWKIMISDSPCAMEILCRKKNMSDGLIRSLELIIVLGKDLIYGKMWCGILRMKNVKRCI